MKIYQILGLAGLLGCSHDAKMTAQDGKTLFTESNRTIADAVYPDNTISAIGDSMHDLRYGNAGRAINNLTRIDPSISHQPLYESKKKGMVSRNYHNATDNLDQRLEEADLVAEHVLHWMGLK